MNFGGVQKNSFIDFPGKISCVLFLTGCNFKCPYCHNPGLVDNRHAAGCKALAEADVYHYLKERRGYLDGVVISGGEPTLQGDLADLCRRVKDMGYPVKLDTNGSRPQVVADLIARDLVDYIAMDIKADPFHYAPLVKKELPPEKIIDSVAIIKASGRPHEFRTTCLKSIVDATQIEGIAQLIHGADLYALQRFHPTADMLCPEYCKDGDQSYGDDELLAFKALARPWVKACVIR